MVVYERSQGNIALRVNIALAVCILCFFVLGVRLWYLQIIEGEFFREKSENNRIRTVYVPPPRGLIFDRNGVVLAKNRPSFDVDFVSEDAPNPKEVVVRLAQILGRDPGELLEQFSTQRRRRRFESKLLLKDVDRETVARVEAKKYELPGIVIHVNPTRDYIHGDLAAHVIGYIREISSRQLELPDFSQYRQGDMVGQFGLEAQWEQFLQGKRGVRRVIVNATGNKIGESDQSSLPIQGHNLTVTLDIDVQRAADEALKDKKGAVVAMDPMSGEILALTSAPAFDPNVFTQGLKPEVWRELREGRQKRLSNRAIQGVYPPGSVFKIMMAVAALAEGVMSSSERVTCPGFYTLGSARFGCHKKTGHGSVNLEEAMIQSCDVYFYTAGQRLGVDRIHDYAVRFGLGQRTGIRLKDESEGLIPSTEWKRRYFRRPEDKKWYPGETPSVAIGQGAVTVTPLQLARSVSALVNGGRILVPHLVKSIHSNSGEFRDEDFGPEEIGKLGMDPKIIDEVRKSLFGVVNDPRGTARKAQLDPVLGVSVAGKTGTAQVVSLQHTKKHEDNNDHAWFTAYAPERNPEIVVVALVENGGHGGAAAAPIVRQVMESYFRKKQGPNLPRPEGEKR